MINNATINVDFSKKIGKLKAVHGVCNGPICRQGLMNHTNDFIEIGAPYIRYHDTDSISDCYIDISHIFVNFDADETDENNYLFVETDRILLAAQNVGAKIIYRLGESIDHDIVKRKARPPKDFNKWVRICANIIRHYNYGWANGYKMRIERWEIWNEPECESAGGTFPMWTDGTLEQAFNLYKCSAELKKEFPEIMLGGMAFTAPNKELQLFVEFCKANNLPLDFVSLHMYFDDVSALKKSFKFVRDILVENGYACAEIIFDEWNFFGDSEFSSGELWVKSRKDPVVAKRYFDNMKGMMGASFCAAALIEMNDCEVDIANYYDAQSVSRFCGFFDVYGNKLKPFYAFKAYNVVYKASKARFECLADDVYAVATEKGILISNYKNEAKEVTLSIKNLNSNFKIITKILDDTNDLKTVSTDHIKGEFLSKTIPMQSYSVALIEFIF